MCFTHETHSVFAGSLTEASLGFLLLSGRAPPLLLLLSHTNSSRTTFIVCVRRRKQRAELMWPVSQTNFTCGLKTVWIKDPAVSEYFGLWPSLQTNLSLIQVSMFANYSSVTALSTRFIWLTSGGPVAVRLSQHHQVAMCFRHSCKRGQVCRAQHTWCSPCAVHWGAESLCGSRICAAVTFRETLSGFSEFAGSALAVKLIYFVGIKCCSRGCWRQVVMRVRSEVWSQRQWTSTCQLSEITWLSSTKAGRSSVWLMFLICGSM